MAKRFSFRLDSLLKLRSYKVGEAKEALNQALRARIEKEMNINERNDYLHDFIKTDIKPKTVSELQAAYHHKVYVKEEITQLEADKVQIIEIENFRRGKLTEAMKAEKIIEKLKEKKVAEHKEELAREELNFLDEIAIRRHNPKDFND